MKILVCSAILAAAASVALAQDKTAGRTFMFVGTPNAGAWKFLIENPGDREASVRGPIEKLGGKLVSYYWGLGDGNNYITVSLLDDPTLIQAFYLTRLGDGLLESYQMIELISSPEMAEALERVKEVKAVDDL